MILDKKKETNNILNISEVALRHLYEVLQTPEFNGKDLRMFVAGGGCSGMQYGFYPEDKNKIEEDDTVLELTVPLDNGTEAPLRIIIDPTSLQYLDGAIINYNENAGRFAIHNPQIPSGCSGCSGCGH